MFVVNESNIEGEEVIEFSFLFKNLVLVVGVGEENEDIVIE